MMCEPSREIDIDTEPDHRRSWWGVVIKFIAILALVGGLFLLFHYALQPYMSELEEFMRELGAWGPLLYIAVFLIATSIFIPESIIAIAAGAIFGLWMGLLWVVVACTITAVFIFAIGRHFLRERVEVILGGHPKIKAIDKAASDAGFRLMVLLRLSPLNYTLLGYLLAVSRARFKPYFLACFGMIPGNFSTVYIGFAAKHAADLAQGMEDCGGKLPSNTSLTRELTIFIGLGAAILATVVVARIAMREIRKATKEASEVPS